ncbi:MAG TPA: M23 family metallopeptidase, partial [bacterium]|nr:M23 family metallopeptidase [bacterium]
MKFFRVIVVLFFVIKGFSSQVNAQDYLWPTDASRYLTSSFAEYRSAHFHAGIDVKTWGQEGYKVFAVRDGYISQIRVSPFGYGKVIYQKLDTGETAVYAHLSRFNDELNDYVKQQQQRNNAYRLTRYFKADRFPVTKGQLIGYTGSTGTGAPHLHFEIRDVHNRPINPFLRGYQIRDNVPPSVTALSISPLDANSRINADVLPLIIAPKFKRPGVYEISESLLLSGNIGFAVNCFDKADGVEHRFAVYKADFYVDGILQFSSQYDRISFAHTHFVNMDRDYRLRMRGFGSFQNLYKTKHNQLPVYRPAGDEVGVLRCDPSLADGTILGQVLGPGEHNYSIELADFWGNVTTLTGKFLVAEKIMVNAEWETPNEKMVTIRNLRSNHGKMINNAQVLISEDGGWSWNEAEVSVDTLFNKLKPEADVQINVELIDQNNIVKLSTVDNWGQDSHPLFIVPVESPTELIPDSTMFIEKDFYHDYVRIEINAIQPIISDPELWIHQIGASAQQVELIRVNLNTFFAVYQFIPQKDGVLTIEINFPDRHSSPRIYRDQFDIQTVTPQDGGTIISQDGKCRVSLAPRTVYDNLFLRMNRLPAVNDPKYDAIGYVYDVQPFDVLLKGKATLELEFPVSDTLPKKLGIYRQVGDRWRFIGTNRDLQNQKLTANIS